MVESSDIEYKKTKLIKQGKKMLSEAFKPLAKWISEKYDVCVLDIQHEYMKHHNMVRVSIHLETPEDAIKFRESDDWWSNFDSKKQEEIALKYIEFGNVLKIPSNNTFTNLFKKKPNYKDVFVSFSSFKPIAQEETISLIPEKRINDLQSKIDIQEIWTISRCFSSMTLLVYEDAQKNNFTNTEIFTQIENKLFELLKEFDEFDYWKRENFKLGIDSKQNLDENYEGNWYYYYK